MKKLFSICLLLTGVLYGKNSNAQALIEGKDFYDKEKTQLKEAYHYILKYRYNIRRETGDTVIDPNPIVVKNGPCVLYRLDGTMEASGNYRSNTRTGEWTFYDAQGRVIRKENY